MSSVLSHPHTLSDEELARYIELEYTDPVVLELCKRISTDNSSTDSRVAELEEIVYDAISILERVA